MNKKIGRNDPCPCTSGKKYKHCYLRADSNCASRKQEEKKALISQHNKREVSVFRFFKEAIDDTKIILLKTEKGHDRIPPRIQMIIAFSLIDMLANYWYEYLGKKGKTNERAQQWYSSFCKIEENKYYQGLITELSAERLYVFRNSIVHFFGLGEETDDMGLFITLGTNDLPDETQQKWQKAFLTEEKKVMIIRPGDFYDLVREGATIMLREWGKTIEQAKNDPQRETEYIEGISRVWQKVNKEGAIMVMNEKISRN